MLYSRCTGVELSVPTGIVVHGGAGRFKEDEYADAVAACRAAVESAQKLLPQGASALDLVEAAVRSLESAPVLNAGHGATLNRDGVIELDALIMDGCVHQHQIGAVASVHRIEHPVTLARYVMERTPHHFLVGAGAEQFAQEQGIPFIDPASLLTERQLLGAHDTDDTVGAVALDAAGNVAVAVSTGGIRGKLPGRVGDTAIAGAGGYADNDLGAACATGVGEGIMRSLLTFRAVEMLYTVDNAQAAAEQVLELFTQRFDGDGGLIMIDKRGTVGIAHNTRHMPVAWLEGDRIRVQMSRSGSN